MRNSAELQSRELIKIGRVVQDFYSKYDIFVSAPINKSYSIAFKNYPDIPGLLAHILNLHTFHDWILVFKLMVLTKFWRNSLMFSNLWKLRLIRLIKLEYSVIWFEPKKLRRWQYYFIIFFRTISSWSNIRCNFFSKICKYCKQISSSPVYLFALLYYDEVFFWISVLCLFLCQTKFTT